MNNLTDFLRKKRDEEKKQEIDWQKTKSEWIETLSILFEDIKEWLSEPVKESLLNIQDDVVKLSEEHLGEYEAPCLIIRSNEYTIKIFPVGRLIIGARGRVDMESVRGKAIFLYLSAERGWVYLQDKVKKLYPKLDEDLFAEILKEFLV